MSKPANSRQSVSQKTGGPQMDLLFSSETGPPQPVRIRAPWKVCELVTEIRNHVEREYRDLRVEGEISNLREAASGHIYFTLKDEHSQLPVVLFRGKARLLKFRPKDGLEVEVRGGVSIYEDRGQLQMVAESMQPRGKGSLQVAFEQLYARLKHEGLFDADRKRPLPAYPRVVGVITSPHGAVIHDILNVLARRHAAVQVLLYPVIVQGEGSVAEIVQALLWFQQNPGADVLIVARGGGSLEDMAAFNSEAVARAIAGSAVPVLSAVGHETDFTIADFVADLRAPTPSAAAELVTDAQYRVGEHLAQLSSRLERAARYQRMRARERFARMDAAAVFLRVQHAVERSQQRLDELRFRLEATWGRARSVAVQQVESMQAQLMQQDIRRQLSRHRERLQALDTALIQAARIPMERRRTYWSRADDRLLALSPLAVLERGYALVYGPSGALIKDSNVLRRGEVLTMRFARGLALAQVAQAGSEEARLRDKEGPSNR